MKFNIIGFGIQNYSVIPPDKYRHCVIHPGIRLTSKPDEPGVLWCCQCGTPYLPKDTATEENFQPTANPKTQTRIIQPKKKRKYYADDGNEITDETLLKDVMNGKHPIKYNEYKIEGDPNKPKRYVRRK